MTRFTGSGAAAPRFVTPESDEAPGLAGGGRFQGDEKVDRFDSRATPRAGGALRVIEGERMAAEFLAKNRAQQAGPDELAVIVSMLHGATLRGFCAVISKALGVRHG